MSTQSPFAAELNPASEINRPMITLSIMLATVIQALDGTIANVALPHMQGNLSASQDQITWVLTSFIVAAAIAMPLTGWLCDRFGQKNVFLSSVAGFTLASVLCGLSGSLAQIVAARLLQGAFGAALVPLSQAVLLDINPREKQGQAMAICGNHAQLVAQHLHQQAIEVVTDVLRGHGIADLGELTAKVTLGEADIQTITRIELHARIVRRGQGLQGIAAAPSFKRDTLVVKHQADFTFWQCTQDVLQLTRAQRDRGVACTAFHDVMRRDLDFDVSRQQGQRVTVFFDQYIGEDWQGMPLFNNARNRLQGRQQRIPCCC